MFWWQSLGKKINRRMIGRRCKIITFENVDEAEKKVQINSGFGQLFWLFALSSCHWKLYWIIGKIENIHLTLPVSRKKMEDKLSNVACITQKNPDGMNSADVSTEAKQIANIPICLLIICNTYHRVHLKKKKITFVLPSCQNFASYYGLPMPLCNSFGIALECAKIHSDSKRDG